MPKAVTCSIPSFARSRPYPILKASGNQMPLGCIHIDAHCDTDGLDVIGGDVVEIAPQYDAAIYTAQVGAQMLFEILSLMTLNDNWPGGE